MKIMVINGPNLNRLGKRKKEHYGTFTLEDLQAMIIDYAHNLDASIAVDFMQSNHEGEIIDCIHQLEEAEYDGCIINAGAYTHYSYAIRDAIESMAIPFVEVHLSDVENREAFRRVSVIEPVCTTRFLGEREASYFKAIQWLHEAK